MIIAGILGMNLMRKSKDCLAVFFLNQVIQKIQRILM